MTTTKKWQMARRTFLRGAGAMVALPLLDVMRPSVICADEPRTPVRLVTLVFPHGLPHGSSTGSGEGTSYELPDKDGRDMFGPLDAYRDDFLTLAGLSRAWPDGISGDHPIGHAQILTHQLIETGTTPTMTTSFDQLAAAHFAETNPRLPSLDLQAEGMNELSGRDGIDNYYGSFLSWNGATPRVPLTNTGEMFGKIFGDGFESGRSAAEAAELRRQGQSVLDSVVSEIGRLDHRLGAGDRVTMERYLDSVRSLEMRIASTDLLTCTPGDRPDSSESYPERLDQILDLMVLAMKCDATRVITLNLSDVHSAINMSGFVPGTPNLGYHSMSHSYPSEHAEGVKYWATKFAELIARLKAEPDAEGTLLDNSIVLMTSELADGLWHRAYDMPVFVAGKGGGALRPGRRVDYGGRNDTKIVGEPIAKLYVSLLQALGLPIDAFKGVSGGLAGLT